MVKGKILWFLFFRLPLREVKPSDKQDNERVGRGRWELRKLKVQTTADPVTVITELRNREPIGGWTV